MRRLSLIIFLVVLMTTSAFGATVATWYGAAGAAPNTGFWTDTYWNAARTQGPPATPQITTDEIKLTRASTVCTVNSNIGDYLCMLTIAATSPAIPELDITGGYVGMGTMRVGAGGSTAAGTIPPTGRVVQSGGVLNLHGLLQIGRYGNSLSNPNNGIGYYTISAGTIQYSGADPCGNTVVGGANASGDSRGTFTVIGHDAGISLRNLYVGSDGATTGATGTLEYQIGAAGVSPITATSAHIDAQGANSTAKLVLSLTATLPSGNVLLVNTPSEAGTFDTVTDSLGTRAAGEGANVYLWYGGWTHHYTLTYAYNGSSIALVPEPATIALFGFGLLALVRRPRRK